MPDLNTNPTPLAAFGARLRERRDDILANWRQRVTDDPRLATGAALPVPELNDHLTAVLEDFERRLAIQDAAGRDAAADAQVGDGAAHGLHRWQQGFELAELARELGRLNESVVEEIDRCGTEPALADRGLVAQVHGIWAAVHSATISSSAEEFFKLQQLESAGQIKDLEAALRELRALEVERAELWQQAAHDLRGNLNVVTMATALLTRTDASDRRARFLVSLDSNVQSLGALLADVTSLARLQGGRESRNAAPMDAADMLHVLATDTAELAAQRGLQLTLHGPDPYLVEGDRVKIRRVVQNLVLNALRYTQQGAVQLSWGDDPHNPAKRWVIEVRDTGPGLKQGPATAVAGALHAASEQSRVVQQAEAKGEVAHITLADASRSLTPHEQAAAQAPGEGIGLSIVKRLCTLLDGTIEVDSRAGVGTTFRVLLPKRYEA